MIVKLVLALVGLVCLCLGIGQYFYNKGLGRSDKWFLDGDPDLPPLDETQTVAKGQRWMDRQPFETLSLTSYDGLALKGYYLPAGTPTANTVVIVHGYASTSHTMSSIASFFSERLGCNIFLADCRGHGNSEGKTIGMGWPDRIDFTRWIEYLVRRDPQARIVLYGLSMGSATVLMTSGEDLPANVKTVVADCGYTNAMEILSYHLNRMYHLPTFPIMPLTSLMSFMRSGFFLGDASAVEQVKKTRLPIFFIHGKEDTFVPVEMVSRLYAACPTEKELWIVPGAGHANSYQTATQEYEEKVTAFVGRYLPLETVVQAADGANSR